MLRSVLTFLAGILLTLTPIFIPMVVNGDPVVPAYPDRMVLQLDGYAFVGGATPHVVCAPDGTLQVSAYAKRPDGSEGLTVFRVLPDATMHELAQLRSHVTTRGSVAGLSIDRCYAGIAVVYVDQESASIVVQRGG